MKRTKKKRLTANKTAFWAAVVGIVVIVVIVALVYAFDFDPDAKSKKHWLIADGGEMNAPATVVLEFTSVFTAVLIGLKVDDWTDEKHRKKESQKTIDHIKQFVDELYTIVEDSKKSGEGSKKSGDGSTKSGEGSKKSGDGSTKSGEGSTKSGDGSTKSGGDSTKRNTIYHLAQYSTHWDVLLASDERAFQTINEQKGDPPSNQPGDPAPDRPCMDLYIDLAEVFTFWDRHREKWAKWSYVDLCTYKSSHMSDKFKSDVINWENKVRNLHNYFKKTTEKSGEEIAHESK